MVIDADSVQMLVGHLERIFYALVAVIVLQVLIIVALLWPEGDDAGEPDPRGEDARDDLDWGEVPFPPKWR